MTSGTSSLLNNMSIKWDGDNRGAKTPNDILPESVGCHNIALNPTMRTFGNSTVQFSLEYKPLPNSKTWDFLEKHHPNNKFQVSHLIKLASIETVHDQHIDSIKFKYDNGRQVGLLQYERKAEHTFTFHVLFSVESSICEGDQLVFSESRECSITIEPMFYVEPQERLVHKPGTKPICHPKFVSSRLHDTLFFNGQMQDTVHVSITGLTVELNDVVRKRLGAPHVSNIEKLDIYAESVHVLVPLHVPGATVTIYARNLIFFGDESKISVEPLCTLSCPEVGSDGTKGQDAPTVTLCVTSVEVNGNPNITRFVLRGGKGQTGGPGKHGIDGISVPIIDSCCGHPSPYPKNTVYMETTEYYRGWITTSSELFSEGTMVMPTSGTNGEDSGKPGTGGNGGTLIIPNFELIKGIDIDLSGGHSGDVGQPGTGGKGGKPSPAYFVQAEFGRRKQYEYRITRKEETEDGLPGKGTLPDMAHGFFGTIKYLPSNSPYIWITEPFISFVINYTRELHLSGHMIEVQALLQPLLRDICNLLEMTDDFELLNMDRVGAVEVKVQIEDIMSMVSRGLNPFGDKPGFIPSINFENAVKLFEATIPSEISMMYFTEFVLFHWDRAVRSKERLINLRDGSFKKMSEDIVTLDKTIASLQILHKQMNEIHQEKASYISALKDLEQKLEKLALEKAELTLHRPLWRACIHTFASVSMFIPVPHIQLAGVSAAVVDGLMRSLMNPEWVTPLDSLNYADKIYDLWHFKEMPDKSAHFVKLIKSLDFKDWKKFSGQAKEINSFVEPLVSSMHEMVDVLKYHRIPREFVEHILRNQEMGFAGTSLRAMRAQLDSILSRSELIAQQLEHTMDTMSKLSISILKRVRGISIVNNRLSNFYDLFDPALHDFVQWESNQSKRRLLKAMYYCKQAYEYRMLTPYPGDLNLNHLSDKLLELVKKSRGDDHDMISYEEIETIMSIYKSQLRNVLTSVIERIVYNREEQESERYIALSPSQLQELNSTNELVLSLKDYISKQEERVMIANVDITSIKVQGSHSLSDLIDLRVAHSGTSIIRSDGRLYRFVHHNRKGVTSGHYWRFMIYPSLTKTVKSNISPSEKNLMRLLFGSDESSTRGDTILHQQQEEHKIYDKVDNYLYKPGGWSDLKISLDFTENSVKPMTITEFVLRVTYDYTLIQNEQVMVSIKPYPEHLNPYFKVLPQDTNERVGGRGSIDRIYEQKGQSIIIEADLFCGSNDSFSHFEILGLHRIDGAQHKQNTISRPRIELVALGNLKIIAVYEKTGTVEIM